MIEISKYQKKHETGVIQMMEAIAKEFERPINTKGVRAWSDIVDVLYVALCETKVVGTIALIKMKNKSGNLKLMFVNKAFRGKPTQTAFLLLNKLFDYCRQENITQLYLGTRTEFKAAQHFYSKHGFSKIDKHQLPKDFLDNSLDDVFFKLKISEHDNLSSRK